MIDETIPKFRGVANKVKSYINGMRASGGWRLGSRTLWNELTLRFFVRLTYKSDGHIEFTGLHCEKEKNEGNNEESNALVVDEDNDNAQGFQCMCHDGQFESLAPGNNGRPQK